MKHPPTTPAPPQRSTDALLFVGAILVVGLVSRLMLVYQSLWYDELFSLRHFILQPWNEIVAGTYIPNNHVLFSLLAKLSIEAMGPGADLATASRLPSLLAGTIAPIFLAMLLWKHDRRAAIALGLVATLHPWLASFSGWARGYALLMLLALAATWVLAQRGRPWLYVLLMAAAAYTHPLAVVLAPGHLAVVLLDRQKARPWIIAILIAPAIGAALYLPFLAGASQYWSGSVTASIAYRQFLVESFQHVHLGESSPGIVHAIAGILMCTAGPAIAWRRRPLRPAIVSFGVASAVQLLLPLVVPATGEARAMLWLIPLYALGMFGAFDLAIVALRRGRRAPWADLAWGLPLAFLVMRLAAIGMTPAQPIRDAIAMARDARQENQAIVAAYMASVEAAWAYDGIDATAMRLSADPATDYLGPPLVDIERRAGGRPLLLVFYEAPLRRDAPDLWDHIQANYDLVRRLPGRVSPAAIYVRRSRAGTGE